jgi:triosephosphate isomerase
MHHNHLEAIQVVQRLGYALSKEDYEATEVSLHPPFTDLRSVQVVLQSDRIPVALGAQDCHWEASGAFTGEVSPPMLAKLDVRYVIAGHSERRQLFGETDQDVSRKVRAILAAGMTPIMCVGETLEERDAGGAEDKVRGQVQAGLGRLGGEQLESTVVAYEPIWAIGTGRTATPSDAQLMCAVVRGVVEGLNGGSGARVRVQYGGSVNPTNAAELMGQPDVDGLLVGGASLDPDGFSRIVRYRLGS